MMERYAANESALGTERIARLKESHTAVAGDSPLVQHILLNLVGLGIGHVSHITRGDHADGIITGIGHCLAKTKSVQESLFFIEPTLRYDAVRQQTAALIIIETDGAPQEPVAQQMIRAALAANLCRRHIAPYGAEPGQAARISAGDIVLPNDIQSMRGMPRGDSVLVVGAGGIGSFCAYALAASGVEQIAIMDPDTIELRNMNRQLLYADAIGEQKARTLADRLEKMCAGVKTTAIAAAFDETADVRGYDAVFCCTDSYRSRLDISRETERQQVPLFEAACTPTRGSLSVYIPGKTKPVHEQKDLEGLARREAETRQKSSRCIYSANPSIITPNAIMGSLLAAAYLGSQSTRLYFNALAATPFSRGAA